MGASVFVEWPGISEEIQDAAPGFCNDCKAWASWIANTLSSRKALRAVRQLGLEALLSHNTDGLSAKKIDWRAPREIEAAAETLRSLVAEGDPRVEVLVEIYRAGATDADPVHEELCGDLEDVAEIATFAADHGVERMTLGYYW